MWVFQVSWTAHLHIILEVVFTVVVEVGVFVAAELQRISGKSHFIRLHKNRSLYGYQKIFTQTQQSTSLQCLFIWSFDYSAIFNIFVFFSVLSRTVPSVLWLQDSPRCPELHLVQEALAHPATTKQGKQWHSRLHWSQEGTNIVIKWQRKWANTVWINWMKKHLQRLPPLPGSPADPSVQANPDYRTHSKIKNKVKQPTRLSIFYNCN